MPGRRTYFVLSLLLALFLCAGFALDATTPREPAYKSLSLFAEVTGLVEGNYVDPVDHKKLLRGAYQGLLGGLDPFSGYLPAAEFKALSDKRELEGLTGADVVKIGGGTLIASVAAGSSAEGAGLKPGDQIWYVEGRSTRDLCLQQIRWMLSGEPGTDVNVQVFRAKEQKRADLRLRRAVPDAPAFASRMEASHTAYLKIRDLGRAAGDPLAAALADLRKKGAQRLLLDLRGSTRGGEDDAARVAGLFIGEKPIGTERARGAEARTHNARGRAAWALPVSVLVNGATAGASEILAGALRDGAGAKLLGEKSCGYGAKQEFIPLPSGDGVVLSVASWSTPSGESWNGKGLKADVAVAFDYSQDWAAADEKQLRRAIEIAAGDKEPDARAA